MTTAVLILGMCACFVYRCLSMQMCIGVRAQCPSVFLNGICTLFWLCWATCLASKPFEMLGCMPSQELLPGAGNPTSGPHAHTASMLLTKSSPQSTQDVLLFKSSTINILSEDSPPQSSSVAKPRKQPSFVETRAWRSGRANLVKHLASMPEARARRGQQKHLAVQCIRVQ